MMERTNRDKPKYRERSGRKGNRYQNNHKYHNPHFQALVIPNLTGATEYLCLTNQDLMYAGNLHRFKSSDFQCILKKMVEDLNILLRFKYDDFWKEIKGSDSLKKCLESCLLVFTRKAFGKHLLQQQDTASLNEFFKDQNYAQWKQLIRIVLFIYHRMICQSRAEQKTYIYQNWLLDIPKMLNIIDIYGSTSPKIIQQLVTTAITKISQYKDDITDFIAIFRTNILDNLLKNIQFEYTEFIIKKAKDSFSNPKQSFTQNLIKSLFSIEDIYNGALNYLKFFPQYSRWLLVSDQKINQTLFDSYINFIDQVKNGWQIDQQLKTILKQMIQKIRQKMAEFLCYSYAELKNLLKRNDIEHKIWYNGVDTYIAIFKQFLTETTPKKQYWENLIHLLFADNPNNQLFFITEKMSRYLKNSNKSKLDVIKKCSLFQKLNRIKPQQTFFKQLKQKQTQAIFKDIPSFKQWENFNMNNLDQSFSTLLQAQTTTSFLNNNNNNMNNFEQQSFLDMMNKADHKKTKKIEQIAKKRELYSEYQYKQYDDEPEDTYIPPVIGIGYQSEDILLLRTQQQQKQYEHFHMRQNKNNIESDLSMQQSQSYLSQLQPSIIDKQSLSFSMYSKDQIPDWSLPSRGQQISQNQTNVDMTNIQFSQNQQSSSNMDFTYSKVNATNSKIHGSKMNNNSKMNGNSKIHSNSKSSVNQSFSDYSCVIKNDKSQDIDLDLSLSMAISEGNEEDEDKQKSNNNTNNRYIQKHNSNSSNHNAKDVFKKNKRKYAEKKQYTNKYDNSQIQSTKNNCNESKTKNKYTQKKEQANNNSKYKKSYSRNG